MSKRFRAYRVTHTKGHKLRRTARRKHCRGLTNCLCHFEVNLSNELQNDMGNSLGPYNEVTLTIVRQGISGYFV